MSYKGYAPALQLQLRPSRRLQQWILMAHGGAFLGLWIAQINPWLQWAFSPLIFLHLLYTWRRFGRLTHALSLRRVEWASNGHWTLYLHHHPRLECLEAKDIFMSPWLTLLRFRIGGHNYPLLILNDGVDAEAFRRLRVRLKQNGR